MRLAGRWESGPSLPVSRLNQPISAQSQREHQSRTFHPRQTTSRRLPNRIRFRPVSYFPVTASNLWSIRGISGFAMKFFHTNPVRWFSIMTTIGAWFRPM
jgi:hypothetical protein